jgi:uncharacterized short protein YbdD (DUF466 family)
MGIDYLRESEKYRPETIKTLLVGEAPPFSGKTYFYVPCILPNAIPVENDRSLPATIFNHYFQERPRTTDQYVKFLLKLKEKRIFLIDICSEPIKVRGCPEGLARITAEIQELRQKIANRDIHVPDHDIVFLLARNNYVKHIRTQFPDSKRFTWKHFRMSSEPWVD